MAIAIGIKVPLNYSEDGFQPTLTIAEEAVEDMTNLVLTNKGELAWNESFGVGLEKYYAIKDTGTLQPTTSLGFLFDPASGMVGAPSTAPVQVPIGMQNPNL